MTVTVGVVDDGSLAFRGVVEVLNGAPDVTLVGVFPSLGAVLTLEVVPDVLITDRYCVDAARQVRQARQFVACPGVLVVSGSADLGPAQVALSAGALGYLGPYASADTLLRAVDTVGSGDCYVTGRYREAVHPPRPVPATRDDATVGARPLSERERDVLTLVAQGLTHKQIASRLSLSKATVDTYVHRLRQKTGMSNKAGLTRVAMGFDAPG
ncbi:response regulator transcription factor [Micromonospora peucetia]|uniref:response regulator transcription factor n=1 Tax=Micromonospora peucetia TaxID=47871 RepID=UPI002256C4BF|nr:response regulator transcription factor [Micromonospora peucetia]MCX4390208.1 response regulator transcription factor [Micromonospora peucetia]